MKKELLFGEGNYTIWREAGIPNEAFSFLDNVKWGNEGAVYEHKNTAEHIRHIARPTLLSVRENDQILITAVFCNTTVCTGNENYTCYYVRYFAASEQIRGKGITRHFSGKVMEVIRQNELNKTIYFAAVERGNKGSYKVVESAGYENIGTIKTLGFSRFFPKATKAIEQVLTAKGKQEVRDLLKKNYFRHSLVQFDALFINEHYFVIRENNEIVAGCQYHRAHWIVKKMAGFSGKLIMNIAPKIPLLNKLFNPARFEFLGFEGIFLRPGYENHLMKLFEGLLHREQLNSAIFWMGETCPFYKKIVEHRGLGLLHSFVKESDIYILADFKNTTEHEISHIKSTPLYASAFDYL